MKITTFNPMIVTKNAEDTIKLFEELGFEKSHSITVSPDGKDIDSVRMKDASGFHIDIAHVESLPQDMTLIRMNVDDFDEAFKLLTEKGFTNRRGNDTVDTATNRSAMMTSPSGFAFDLCQHIKENDQND